MKKVIVISAIVIIALIIFSLLGVWFVNMMFEAQYNSKGVSSLLFITIDKNQPKEFVGQFEGYDVYIENLNLDETNFRTIDAENLPIKEVLEKHLVFMDDWRKKAWNIKKDGENEILQYDNYEIAITDNECLIRPKTR